jgi:hypothetical protein
MKDVLFGEGGGWVDLRIAQNHRMFFVRFGGFTDRARESGPPPAPPPGASNL